MFLSLSYKICTLYQYQLRIIYQYQLYNNLFVHIQKCKGYIYIYIKGIYVYVTSNYPIIARILILKEVQRD